MLLPLLRPVTVLAGLVFAFFRLSGVLAAAGGGVLTILTCGLRGLALCFAPDLEPAAILPRDLPFTYRHLTFDLPATTVLRIGCFTSTISARTAESVSFSTVGDTAGNTAVSPACSANS